MYVMNVGLELVSKAPFTRYNRLSNQLTTGCIVYINIQPVVKRLDVCLHDTAGCQTGCITGLTTGCIV